MYVDYNGCFWEWIEEVTSWVDTNIISPVKSYALSIFLRIPCFHPLMMIIDVLIQGNRVVHLPLQMVISAHTDQMESRHMIMIIAIMVGQINIHMIQMAGIIMIGMEIKGGLPMQ